MAFKDNKDNKDRKPYKRNADCTPEELAEREKAYAANPDKIIVTFDRKGNATMWCSTGGQKSAEIAKRPNTKIN